VADDVTAARAVFTPGERRVLALVAVGFE